MTFSCEPGGTSRSHIVLDVEVYSSFFHQLKIQVNRLVLKLNIKAEVQIFGSTG